MNIFRIIFSFYLVVLSLMPCTDALDRHEEESQMEIAHSDSDHSHEHEDTCPPLCSCNCCGVSIAFFYPENFSIELVSYNEKGKTALNQSSVSFFTHTIWQPPKI